MSNPARRRITWRPVLSTIDEWERGRCDLRPIEHSDHVERDRAGLRHGHMAWGRPGERGLIRLAWEWREVRPNVIVIADPMTVASNVRLVDDRGVQLGDGARLLTLNNAIYDLAWKPLLRRPPTVNVQLLAA